PSSTSTIHTTIHRFSAQEGVDTLDALNIRCPHCRSPHRQIKWGRTPAGSQKYRCHACVRVYTPARKEPGHPPEVRQAALRLHREGHNYRSIGRLLGVHRQSVVKWVNPYRRQECPAEPESTFYCLSGSYSQET